MSKLYTVSKHTGSMASAIAVVTAFERLRGMFPFLQLPAEHVGVSAEEGLAVLEEYGLADHYEQYDESIGKVLGWYELTSEGRALLTELLKA